MTLKEIRMAAMPQPMDRTLMQCLKISAAILISSTLCTISLQQAANRFLRLCKSSSQFTPPLLSLPETHTQVKNDGGITVSVTVLLSYSPETLQVKQFPEVRALNASFQRKTCVGLKHGQSRIITVFQKICMKIKLLKCF